MFLALLILCSLFYFCFLSWCTDRFKMVTNVRKLPSLSGSVPIFGHLFLVLKYKDDLFTLMKNWAQDMLDHSQNVAVLWLGPVPIVCIIDPKDALTISNECMEKSSVYKFSSSWVGQGLVTAKYATWRKHRKLITPSFNPTILNDFISVFNEAAHSFIDKVNSCNEIFDPMPLLSKYNMEVLCQTVLGLSKHSILVKGYETDVKFILNLIIKRFMNLFHHSSFLYRFSETFSLEKEVTTRLKAVSKEVINKKNNISKDHQDVNGNGYSKHAHKFKAFLDLLIELRDQGSMNDQEVREELDTMIVAGYDTSYSALSFILPMLGKHQDVQQRVYDELESIFKDSNRDVEKDDLSRMVYLDTVIKEILRLYPIAPILGRRMTKSVKLQNLTIERGCDSILMAYGMNRHLCWGEDRYEFNPDRWLKQNVPEYAFASFGIGRRHCIGKTYSFMSIKTLLTHILRKYKILKEEGDIVTGYTVLAKPKAGHRIRLEKRHEAQEQH